MAGTPDDERIAAEVGEAIQHDSRIQAKDVSIDVREGVTTLAGTVRSYRDRIAAAEDAWRIKGVQEVRNLLTVQPDALRSSSEIAADVAVAIEKDPRVDAKSIVVNVTEGVVRLSGTVANESERRAAEECAWQTEGTAEVANELTVVPSRRRTDTEIERDVRTALVEDAAITDPTAIAVRSLAGTVRLQGSVWSADERQAAEKDAWYTAGVVYVENMLTIEGKRQRQAAA